MELKQIIALSITGFLLYLILFDIPASQAKIKTLNARIDQLNQESILFDECCQVFELVSLNSKSVR